MVAIFVSGTNSLVKVIDVVVVVGLVVVVVVGVVTSLQDYDAQSVSTTRGRRYFHHGRATTTTLSSS